MDWIRAVKDIQDANNKNQLVIFVGSGVSANSKMPTWFQLIRKIATEINYYHCENCKLRNNHCEDLCKCRDEYTQEEMLRIPEYLYNLDRPKEEYYDFIKNSLNSSSGSNSIHELIFKIFPHHIITTNFDSLLEDTQSINRVFYSVLREDKDLLSEINHHYIIKMHGDINKPESIVLKESDYIEYEQRHILISTFIKSLLIDHTFLFIGYSLNDYNLKLIIGWINYFSNIYNIDKRPNNYIVQDKDISPFEVSRLKKSNIHVIQTKDLPTSKSTINIPEDLSDERGKALYWFLNSINNPSVIDLYTPIEAMLINRIKKLDIYNYISIEDLLFNTPLEKARRLGCSIELKSEQIFVEFIELLGYGKSSNRIIQSAFKKSIITEVYHFETQKNFEFEDNFFNYPDKYMQLYLDNNYTQLIKELDKENELSAKIYYYSLLGWNLSDIPNLFDLLERHIYKKSEVVKALLFMINSFYYYRYYTHLKDKYYDEILQLFDILPKRENDSISFLKKFFMSMSSNLLKMESSLSRQEKKYSFPNNSVFYSHSYHEIWEIQSYVFDYYYFMKKNFIFKDYFPETRDYLSYYIRAILCSYSPKKLSNFELDFGLTGEHFKPYYLDEIEIDMIVKYMSPKDLVSWMKKYKVGKIFLKPKINILNKFVNLCDSINTFFTKEICQHLNSFVILLRKIDIDKTSIDALYEALINMLEKEIDRDKNRILIFFDSIYLFVMAFFENTDPKNNTNLLNLLLIPEITFSFIDHEPYKFKQILDSIGKYSTHQSHKLIIDCQNSLPASIPILFFTSFFLDIIEKEQVEKIIDTHLDEISGKELFEFINAGYLTCSSQNADLFVKILKEHEKIENSGVKTIPDHIQDNINRCILLTLLGKPIELKKLAPYKERSSILYFLLEPDSFDYSKIDLDDYMWINVFRHPQYREILQSHRKDIQSPEIIKSIKDNRLNVEQQKVVFGVLYQYDELTKILDEY